jgi:IS66 C-terminal element
MLWARGLGEVHAIYERCFLSKPRSIHCVLNTRSEVRHCQYQWPICCVRALGRKLWMFCYDKIGAQASANLFSLVMTARANGVEPFEYLSTVFEQFPAATTVEAIEALLPWNLRPILEARRKRQQGAPQIAAT